ncbi:hypothetical protein D3C80_1724330 [compost metagenome]
MMISVSAMVSPSTLMNGSLPFGPLRGSLRCLIWYSSPARRRKVSSFRQKGLMLGTLKAGGNWKSVIMGRAC